ncbi:hypothetical protein C8J57DRAFT_1211555 [Mycena rebaudengoi]|nr:hypothetical protein C8J57DRAFT_1211555 [Mycena rebaudengoi]
MTELGLRMRQIEFSESALRCRTLSSKDIKWKDYPRHLKCLWCSIEECERQVRDIRISIGKPTEKYTREILHRRTTLETIMMLPVEKSLYGGPPIGRHRRLHSRGKIRISGEYAEAAQLLWNAGRAASASPNISRSRGSAV